MTRSHTPPPYIQHTMQNGVQTYYSDNDDKTLLFEYHFNIIRAILSMTALVNHIQVIAFLLLNIHFTQTKAQCDGCSVSCSTPGYCYPCNSCYRGYHQAGCGSGGSFCFPNEHPEILPTTYTFSDADAAISCDPNRNTDNTWCSATTTDPQSYVELDLGEMCEVLSVGGIGVESQSSWVTLFRLQYSRDAILYEWYPYTIPYGPRYTWYKAEYSEYERTLSHPLYARYLRFTPLAWNGTKKALGFRAYGDCSNFTLSPTLHPASQPITVHPATTAVPTSPTTSPTPGYIWYNVKKDDITSTSELNVNTTYLTDKNGNLVIELRFDTATDNHFAAFINNDMDENPNTLWSMIKYKQEFHGRIWRWSILGNTYYGLYTNTNIGLYEFDSNMDTLIDSDILYGTWNDYETRMNTSDFWYYTNWRVYNVYRGYVIVEQRRMLNESNAGIYFGGESFSTMTPGLTSRFSDIAVAYYSDIKTRLPTEDIVIASSHYPSTAPIMIPKTITSSDPTLIPSSHPTRIPSSDPTLMPSFEVTIDVYRDGEVGNAISSTKLFSEATSISEKRKLNIFTETIIGMVGVACICCCIDALYFLLKYKKKTGTASSHAELRLSNDIEMRQQNDEFRNKNDIGTQSHPNVSIAHHEGENRKREGSSINDNDNRDGKSFVNCTNGNVADDEFIVESDNETPYRD